MEKGEKQHCVIVQQNSFFFLGDILGYKTLNQNEKISQFDHDMCTLVIALDNLKKINFGLDHWKSEPDLHVKLETHNFPKELYYDYKLYSDTIILFQKNLNMNDITKEAAATIIVGAAKEFFNGLIKKHILLRGVINYGLLKMIIYKDEIKTIYGKSYVDSFYYENKQNWGGIIVTPDALVETTGNIRKALMCSDYSIPFKKDDIITKYNESGTKPHCLDWTDWLHEEIDFKKLYIRADKIDDIKIREEAKEKIENTEKFYLAKKR